MCVKFLTWASFLTQIVCPDTRLINPSCLVDVESFNWIVFIFLEMKFPVELCAARAFVSIEQSNLFDLPSNLIGLCA